MLLIRMDSKEKSYDRCVMCYVMEIKRWLTQKDEKSKIIKKV